MNSAFIAILSLVAGSTIVGITLMITQIHSCQEGYEDENGFHFGRFAQEQVRAKAIRANVTRHEAQHAA